MNRKPPYLLGIALLGALAGCKLYRPLVLDAKAKSEALTAPDLVRVSAMASELRHPLLKPRAIDPREGLSPEEAAILAVLLNPDLKAVRDQRALANAQLIEAGLLPDPVLSLSRDVPVGDDTQGLTTAHSSQLSLDVTSLLTRGLRRRAAKTQQESVELDIAWQEWQVAEAAKLSSYRLEALGPQVAWAEESIAALDENLQAIEQGAKSGVTSLNDLAAARSGLDSGRRALLALSQSRERERQLLNSLLGLPPSTNLTLKPAKSPRAWTLIPSEEEFLRDLDRRLDLVALEKGYASEDARFRLAVWSQFPSIGISFNRSRDTSNVLTHGSAIAFSLPLLNGARGQIALEEATRKQLYDQYLARLAHARADVALACMDIRQMRSMIATAEQTLPDLERQAQASESAFKAGNLDLLARNQARVALLSQKATLSDLRTSLDELAVVLELATGRPLPSTEAQP